MKDLLAETTSSSAKNLGFLHRIKQIPFYFGRKLRRWVETVFKSVVDVILGFTAWLDKISQSTINIKGMFVRKMFWGRGSWYKNSFHTLVIGLTLVLVASGIFTSRMEANAEVSALDYSYGSYGNNDLLAQGATLSSVVAINKVENYSVVDHQIKAGESLQDIANMYGLSKDTVKWANPDVLSPYNDNVQVGMDLKIPEMDGVLRRVESGDTLDSILAETKGNRFDVIHVNELNPPQYALSGKEYIFVPNGELPPPPPLITPRAVPSGNGYISPGRTGQSIAGKPTGFFDDPLSDPACAGYANFRGFIPGGFPRGHTGVDLGKLGGCPIRSVANGWVEFVGILDSNTGYAVIINHGDGLKTHYYHGDGNIWVRAGQQVSKGQPIMYMGCSGNCRGTHLHLTLKYNGQIIDPAPYIPYRR